MNEVSDDDFAPNAKPVQSAPVVSESDFAPGALAASDDDFAPSVARTEGITPSEAAEVKARVSAMPQYREGFFGPELVKEGGAKTYKPGEYGAEIKDKVFGPPDDVKPAIAAAEEYDKQHNWSFTPAWDKFVNRMKKEQMIGEATTQHVNKTNPINIVAQNTVGAAGRAAQQWLGKPAAAIMLKGQMGALPNEGGIGAPPVPPPLTDEQAKEFGVGALPQKTATAQTPQEEFVARHKGASLAELRPPSKYVTPGTKEFALREFWSSTASDDIKIQGEQREIALRNLTPIEVGGYSIAPLVAKGIDMAGELPYYALLTTGAGARAQAKRMSQINSGPFMPPKELLSAVKGAERHGMATEFAAQSALVSAKNREDVGSGAMEGYVAGQVLSAFGQLVTRSKGAKATILKDVNAPAEALMLPPVTWAEYVKSATESAQRAATMKGFKKTPAAEVAMRTDPRNYTAAYPQAQEPFVEVIEAVKGDAKAPHTFKTVEYGKAGELRVSHYLSNAKTGEHKLTYSERLQPKHKEAFLKTGDTPSISDPSAYTAYLDEMFPHPESRGALSIGKPEYKAPEEAAAMLDKSIIQKPVSKVEPPPVRDDTPTRVARLLTVEKNGDVKSTPMRDRTPTKAIAATPKQPEVGDVVHLPDEQLGIVDEVRDGQLTVNLRNGEKVKVSPAEVALGDENMLSLSDIFMAEPAYTAKPKDALRREKLLKFKELDVKRVMNATGAPPHQSLLLLKEMEKAGQLIHDGGGLWIVRKSYKPEALTGKLKEEGFRYYYNISKDGQGLSGVVRGRDPKKLGHVLIEVGANDIGPRTLEQSTNAAAAGVQPHEVFTQTKLISIPRSQLRPYVPVLGNANLSQLPMRHGITTPMPPDILITNAASAKAMGDYARMSGQLKKLLKDEKSIMTGLKKVFNHDAWLVPTDLRHPITKLSAQPALVKAQTEVIMGQMGSHLNGPLSLEDQWLSNIMKRRATRRNGKLSEQEVGLERFFRNNPQLNAEAKATIETALTRLKEYEQALAQRGVHNIGDLERLRALGLEDEYAMNVYMKYLTSRKNWAEFVQKQLPTVWNKAYEHVAKKFPNEDFANVEARLQEILGVDVDSLAKQMRTAPNGDVKAKLKERIKLAEEIQGILGKLDSASIQVAHSLATSESILRRVQTWDDIAATPYWSPGPRQDLGPHGGIEVPRSPIYGNAQGGRVHESMRFLLEAKSPQAEGNRMLKTITSIWKFNQVVGGGATPWVNQVMRNWKGFLISGGLQGPDDFRTFFDAAEEMLRYRNNPILAKGGMYDNAMQNGAIGTGFAGSEINKHKAAYKILSAIKRQNGKAKDYWDLVDGLTENIRGTAEEVGAMYDAIDRIFKLTAYMNNYRRSISQGMHPHDAAAFATMRNNQSFVNFEMVSPVTEKMRNSSVSAAAPFISSKMEDMRINGTLLMRLKDEPDLIARMAVATGTVAAAMALMREQRRANGISDDMVKKGLDRRPLGQQAYKPVSMVLPELDKEGRMQVADLTMWEDAFMMLQIHERDFAPAAVLRNNLTGVFGEDTLIGRGIDTGFNVAAGTIPLSAIPSMVERPGEQGWMQALSFIAQNGGLPNAPFKGYNQYMLSQPPVTLKDSIYREQWTPEQSLMKLMGLPFAGPIGIHTEIARARELQRSEAEMKSQIGSVIMNKPEDEQQPLIDSKVKAMQEIAHEYQESKE